MLTYAGQYLGRVLVSLSAPKCVLQIVYTLDGSKPELANEKAQVYTAPQDVC